MSVTRLSGVGKIVVGKGRVLSTSMTGDCESLDNLRACGVQTLFAPV